MEQATDFIVVLFYAFDAYQRFGELTVGRLDLRSTASRLRRIPVRLDGHDYELHSLALRCGARIAPISRIIPRHRP